MPSMFGRGQFYHNNRDGTFTDVTASTLGATPHGAIRAKVFDYDGDGRLDLFVVDMHSDMWMGLDSRHSSEEMATENQHRRFRSSSGPSVNEDALGFIEHERTEFSAHGEDYDALLFGNALYRNPGDGKFTEMAIPPRMETFWPWGLSPIAPRRLASSRRLGGDYEEKQIRGRDAARSSRSAAVADFNGDGRLEIVTNNFNDRPYYFANGFPRKNYLELPLTGTRSNRDAIGAIARLWIGKAVMIRQMNPASGYLAQSSRVLHFGLGDATKVDSVQIRWPRGGIQSLRSPSINTLLSVREPE